LDAADAAADRERDRQLEGDLLHQVHQRPARLQRRADVEEAELVGARGAVGASRFDGIARVAQLLELHALDDAAVLHVEARDDPTGQHEDGPSSAAWPSRTLKCPSYSAVPAMAPASEEMPAAASARRCETAPAPPEAMILASGAARLTSRRSGRSNPSSIPSRETAVTTIQWTPCAASAAASSPAAGPTASVQPRAAARPSLTSMPAATSSAPN